MWYSRKGLWSINVSYVSCVQYVCVCEQYLGVVRERVLTDVPKPPTQTLAVRVNTQPVVTAPHHTHTHTHTCDTHTHRFTDPQLHTPTENI